MSLNPLSAGSDLQILRLGGLIYVEARVRGRSGVKYLVKVLFSALAASAVLPDSAVNFNNELAPPCEDQRTWDIFGSTRSNWRSLRRNADMKAILALREMGGFESRSRSGLVVMVV
jgi:hypothetical protein